MNGNSNSSTSLNGNNKENQVTMTNHTASSKDDPLLLTLPKVDQTSKQKESQSPIRKPAPALLINDNDNEATQIPSLANNVTNNNSNSGSRQQQPQDPLGNPAAFANSSSNTHHHNNDNATSYPVRMSEEQLRAALDHFGDEDEDDNTNNSNEPTDLQSLLLGARRRQAATTTTPSPPTPPHKIIAGAVACLCSATLGAGILALPYAMAEAGLICGMTMLVGTGIATSYSIQLLVQAMQVVYYSGRSGSSSNGEKTYEGLVEACLGQSWRRLAATSMLIFCCGGAVAYVVAVGDILQRSGWATDTRSSKALAMTLAWASAMLPLSMLRTMKSLECTSSIGIASITTLVLAALYHYLEHPGEQAPTAAPAGLMDDDSHQSIWDPTKGVLSILQACPVILLAFSCQVNVCAIYDQMPGEQQETQSAAEDETAVDSEVEAQSPPTATTTAESSSDSTLACSKYRRMTVVTWCAVGICALLYSSISIIALLDFGSAKMTPNILGSYYPESVMQVAFIGMTIAVTLAYPMNIFPARVTLLGIVRTIQARRQQQSVTNNDTDLTEPLLAGEATAESDDAAVDHLEIPRIPESERDAAAPPETQPAVKKDTLVEHVLATLFLTGLSLGLAIVAPNISVVFGLLGGTCSSVLGFVIPGYLGYMTANDFYQVTDVGNVLGESATHAANRRAATRTRIFSLILVVAGFLIGIVTTAATVYGIWEKANHSKTQAPTSSPSLLLGDEVQFW